MGDVVAGVVGFEPTECRSQSPMPYRLAIPLWGNGRGGRIRTYECESQSLVPYRLATPLRKKNNGVSKEIRTLGLQSHNLAL